MINIIKTIALLVTAAVVLFSSNQALAQEGNIYRTLQTPFFDPSSGIASCAPDSGNLVGSNNTERGFNFYVSKGLTAFQSAGIIGNFLRESSMNPRIVQGNPPYESSRIVPGVGYGIAQWTFPARQQNLIEFARKEGRPVSALDLQLNFAWHEAYPGVINNLKRTNNVEAATRYWMEAYERPGVPALDERIALAKNVLTRYGSDTPGGGSDTLACSAGDSGEVSGDYSLPVHRSWYNRYPTWFTKPHHDYPAADIPIPTGTRIFSVSSGRIVSAGDLGACGRGVIINAGGGVEMTYCHGQDAGSVPGAKTGDQVRAGQFIMHSDNTGNSSGAHLHFQIKFNGQLRCPQTLFVGIVRGNVPDIRSLPSSGCSY